MDLLLDGSEPSIGCVWALLVCRFVCRFVVLVVLVACRWFWFLLVICGGCVDCELALLFCLWCCFVSLLGGGLLGGGLLCVLVVSDLVLVGCGFRVVVFLFAVLLVWSLVWVAVVGCLLGVWLGAHAV